MASNIKVYLRVRPTAKPAPSFNTYDDEGVVEFDMPREVPYVNNTRSNFRFKFDGVFGMKATQEEVFKTLAVPVIDDVLQGINGTIFAYGQTGSGKTFTITGGSERYVDRGLIPRALSHLYGLMHRQKGETSYKVYISYLEIYNDRGYDLLATNVKEARKLEDLPKVSLMEDDEGNIHLRNLSVNSAQNEEEALNLLFLGDTNRVVAETPMNDASTRSHCIFIIWVESHQAGSDAVRRAKFHLVDLAGSERVAKTGLNPDETLFKEACSINLALHYLEQVIVALHERARGNRLHVPYRNSMMTSVLRDSLGGNCKTIMVGNVAVDGPCIEETISTCRFAQAVAQVENTATINEETDPNLMIKRLKQEIEELKEEIRILKGEGGEGYDPTAPLTEQEMADCRAAVQAYIEADDPSASISLSPDLRRTKHYFKLMREEIWAARQQQLQSKDSTKHRDRDGARCVVAASSASASAPASHHDNDTVRRLQIELQQRDNELAILMNVMNQKGGLAGVQGIPERLLGLGTNPPPPLPPPTQPSTSAGSPASPSSASCSPSTVEELVDRNRAFEVFRKSVRRTESFEENKDLLRQLYGEAKGLGERANEARQKITDLKTRIEKGRVRRAMEAAETQSCSAALEEPTADAEEEALLTEMEQHKTTYKDCTAQLREVKGHIERIQQLMVQNKARLQRDFERWLETCRRKGPPAAAAAAAPPAPPPPLHSSGSDLPSPSECHPNGVPKYTGHQDTDMDIAKFYQARLAKRQGP
ncbi:unnamed protein product [Vitrella brassicaformis CCMP3155]|uniref:Kinesin-like protein n=2 Tax=Vitrella brassicaformis TaxID=1169539 RepID=A0A0G4G3J6_VITBC|nr:unnamed protein product [Vitrella brassicaformis CCMP3155]|eukprot:CEM22728.1 unnamed protein product [Vitrella brassicaformis CCMP3155]